VATSPFGHRRNRARARRWNAVTSNEHPARLAAHVAPRYQRHVPVQRCVLEALRHHWPGELLPAQDEPQPVGGLVVGPSGSGFQQQHPAQEVVRSTLRAGPPFGVAHRTFDPLPVLPPDRRRPDVRPVHGERGRHVGHGLAQLGQRQVARAHVEAGQPL